MPNARPERLLILGLLLAASVATGCGGPGTPSGLPVEDDFSDCSTGWSTDTDEYVSLSCAGGSYRVLIKNPLLPQNARIFFNGGVNSLNVEADATRRAGPKSVGYGVGCWASRVHGYVFVISPDGAWGIEKISSGASLPTPLAESPGTHAIPGLAATNRIRGVCVGGGLEATTLALYVNGKRIAVAEDRDGFDSFPGFGFFVFASTSGTDVRFDNLVAREPTETETQPVATVSQRVQAPSTSTAAAHSGSKLCRRDGIRYSGTTAQGAEVCFTLTPDGSALIEAGFSFVRASGCPNEAAGTTYSEIPGAVDAHGRVENPDGFTATIRGSRASGVFEDSTICPGKKFNWSARRVP